MNALPPTHPIDNRVRYEKRDVRLRPVVGWIVGLVLLLFIIVFSTASLSRLTLRPSADLPERQSSIVNTPSARELSSQRQREDTLLNSYDWQSRDEGVVRIPIDRAMELAIEKANSNEASQ